ncbi:MAG: hypothetical protein WCD86_13370 [Ktedonobacteraceae bacterium]
MGIVIFILGLPGSGKSSASRHIIEFAEKNNWGIKRFRDYKILFIKFLADRERKRFRSTEYGGFDMLDHTVLDEVLEELNSRIEQPKESVDGNKELLVIEFSRNDYCRALSFFSSHLLKDACFLFIDAADIQTCIQRVKKRVTKPTAERTEDDNDVSEFIFETYYNRDHGRYLESVALQMREQFGIRRENIHVIENGSEVSEEEFHKRITAFAINNLRLNI